MSGHFPRLNLDRPADLDHVLRVINDHAHKVSQMEFGSELERDKALKALVDKMIKRVSLDRRCDRDLHASELTQPLSISTTSTRDS